MSDNLDLTQLVSSQNNKEVTINDKGGELDAALTETLTKTVDSSNAATVTETELQRSAFVQVNPDGVDPPNGAIMVTVDTAFKRGLFVVFNNTAEEVTITISGQSATAPAVPAAGVRVLVLEGSNVRLAGGGAGGGSSSYDFGFAFGSEPSTSTVIQRVQISRAITIPANMAGSTGSVATNPTSQYDIDVQDDGISVGTVSISTGGIFTFTTTSSTQKSIAGGSVVTFVSPGSADGTVEGVAVGILATED